MTDQIQGPAYRIDTQRLVIRCWQPADAPLLKSSIDESIEHLIPWMSWARHEPEELQKKIDRLRQWRGKFDLGDDFVYGIFDPDQKSVLGGTGLHTRLGPSAREIGYWIHKDHLNQGLATEVSAALTRAAFEVDQVDRVEIHCDPTNKRSAKVPQKLGFIHEATLRRRVADEPDSLRDAMIWTMFKDDYSTSPVMQTPINAFDALGRQII